MQGVQNQLYAIYMFLVLFGNINEQIMPMFVPQRDLYEARERPSKMYQWTGKWEIQEWPNNICPSSIFDPDVKS